MKIAIQGHPTRGKEIIQILKNLGATSYGTNDTCSHPEWYWYINKNREVCCNNKKFMCEYKLYTLEEFEKEFPFKIGDKIKHISSIGIIKEYCYVNNKPAYKVEGIESDIIVIIPAKMLEPYKEMKEERNITLTLDKAKEWYNKGGELREIALQAFTEMELNPLPKSWEEFCEKYPVKNGECWIGSQDIIYSATFPQDRKYKTWIPSRRSAKSHLAMIQLEQLRNCWWNGWEPEWNNCEKYVIKWDNDDLIVFTARNIRAFLVFPTREMAYEFLKCFRNLIEQAGDLI